LQFPFSKEKKAEKTFGMLREQYGINVPALIKENDDFHREYKSILGEYKAQAFNYIASQVNYSQFQFQDYTLARIVTELYLKDSVVASCIGAYQMHYPEPNILVYEGDNLVEKNDLLDLMNKPNPWMTQSDLARYIITYQLWTGNAYLMKLYGDGGKLEQLFPFSGMNVYPVPTYDEFVGYFNFVTAEGNVSRIEPENIIHMPWIQIDPRRLFMGVSPMQLCSRDIQISIMLSEHVGNYAKNVALPSLVATRNVKTTNPNNISKESLGIQQAEDIKKTLKERFTGENIGDVLIGQEDWEYTYLGFPLKDLDIQNVVKVHQCNICSNFKIAPEYLKVSAGLQSSTYDNQTTSEISFFKAPLTAAWVQNADKFTNGLRPDFGEEATIEYNIDSVRTIRTFESQRLGTLIPAISAEQVLVSSGQKSRETAIALICMTMALDRKIVEPLFDKQPLSNVTVNREGISVEESAI
jgi:HK97 family phage portal protein